MITAKARCAVLETVGLFALCVTWMFGCASREVPVETEPRPLPLITVAVAPALNLSGSTEFEPLRVADLMASELTQLDGVRVLGVNRVLAVLAQDKAAQVASPQHAVEVCRRLGADAIVVFAITEYDPNDPPVVGMAAQLYAPIAPTSDTGWNPVTASRQATPGSVDLDAPGGVRPRAESQHVFNAANRSVAKEVLRFADERDAEHSPFGGRLYIVSQEHFLRFCCHATARELLGRQRHAAQAATDSGTEPTG